jgi:hypothetical protein
MREQERVRRRVDELTRLIADGEARLKALRASLLEVPGDGWERIARLADEEQKLAKQVDGWTDEWLRLSETADA